ncbi:MAG: pseudouridylate synthase, partial [Leifsonia sp.]
LDLPVTVRNHLVKHRGRMQAETVSAAPANSESLIELETVFDDTGIYRLTPATGRTHQLRMHKLGLGIPISGDPLYPVVQDVAVDNFETPLQLVASEMRFADPVDGAVRHFTSVRSLPLGSEAAVDAE